MEWQKKRKIFRVERLVFDRKALISGNRDQIFSDQNPPGARKHPGARISWLDNHSNLSRLFDIQFYRFI